jgi:hypothetical protein
MNQRGCQRKAAIDSAGKGQYARSCDGQDGALPNRYISETGHFRQITHRLQASRMVDRGTESASKPGIPALNRTIDLPPPAAELHRGL